MPPRQQHHELDIEQPEHLIAYLRHTARIGPTEQPNLQVLGGGVSNRTVRVQRANGESWVIKQALAKLRVAVEWFSSPERIHREALGLRWLEELAPDHLLASFVFEDVDAHLLAMRAVPEPHQNWKTMLLAGELNSGHVEQFGQLLGTIHRESAARRAEAATVFDDRSFFESLRLEPYYGYTAQRVPAATRFLEDLIARTRAHRLSLVHGDYSPKNVLVYRERLVLLDHEVIHFGDPAFDLGFSLTHLLSKAHHLAGQRDAFSSAVQLYWRVYEETVGEHLKSADLEERAVRHTLGCLLARVAGRSPLEYLTPPERARQQSVVLTLLEHPPLHVSTLASEFVARIAGMD